MNNQNLHLQQLRLEERYLRQIEYQKNEETKLKQIRFDQLQKIRLEQLEKQTNQMCFR
jgi:hypothetical protein